MKTLGSALQMLFCALIVGCGSSAGGVPEEQLGQVSQAATVQGSLVKEHQEHIDNADGAVVGALRFTEGNIGDRRSRFVLAMPKSNPGGVRVQLRSLQDQSTSELGASELLDEDVVAISSLRRVRLVTLGPHNFVVVTRENDKLALRSFAVLPPLDSNGDVILSGDDTAGIELRDTVITTDNIREVAVTQIYQPDPEATLQFATVVQGTSNQTKVITWRVDATTGGLVRQATVAAPGVAAAGRIAATSPERPYGVLVTAETLAGETQVTPWSIDPSGTITRYSPLSPGESAATDVTATYLHYGTVAVGWNATSGTVADFAIYDVNPTYNSGGVRTNLSLSKQTQKSFGAGSDDPRSMEMVRGTGGRFFAIGTTSTGGWTVRSWKNVDWQAQTSALVNSGTEFAVSSGTVVRGDRLVMTALNTTSGGVELFTFRDYYTPLVRGDSPASSGTGTAPADPSTAVSFTPAVSPGPELLVAASPHYVVTCSTGSCEFRDKAGTSLGTKSIGSIFNGIAPELETHLQVQYKCDPEHPAADDLCGRGDAIYDTKLLWSPTIQRFIIAAPVRHSSDTNRMRHTVFAVSKEEDPRRGFYLYAITDSLARDGLQAGAAGGMLIISYAGNSESHLQPTVYLFDLQALADNAPEIPSTKLSQVHTGQAGNLIVPAQSSSDPLNTRVAFLEGRFGISGLSGKVFAFWRDLKGPIDLYSFQAFSPALNSGHIQELESMWIDEASDGSAITATVYDAGPTGDDIKVQRNVLSLTEGVGFSPSTPSSMTISCPQAQSGEVSGSYYCTRPTVASHGERFFVSYLRVRRPNAPGTTISVSASGSYYVSWTDPPRFKKLAGAIADTSLGINQFLSGTQVFNAVPDDDPVDWGGDFWATSVFSGTSGAKTPVTARVFRF